MKVYVVEYYNYEESYVANVYNSFERATKAIEEYKIEDEINGIRWEYTLTEFTVIE